MGMGFIDAFPFSIGSFAILDDLDDCSSGTDTYVERRRPAPSHDKSRSKSQVKSKQSVASTARELAHEAMSKRIGKGMETVRSTTAANLFTSEADTRLHGTAATTTHMSTKRSVANETTAKRSSTTAPAALGRASSRRSRRDKIEDDDERKKYAAKKVEERADKKDEMSIEVLTSSKDTIRSISRSRTKSQGPSRGPPISEAETKPDISSEELRKENRALRRRTERLEKDLASYRRHAEHYRERRREADRERLKAEEHARELETVVTNMRESYELELEDVRTQLSEYAAKAAAVASAAQAYAKDESMVPDEREGTIRDLDTSARAPSHREARSNKAPSLHDLSVQTDPVPSQAPPPHRPTTPYPGARPPSIAISPGTSTLFAQLEQREAELRALKLFHEETPQITLETLTSSVRAFNNELRSLAAALVSDVRLGRTWEVAQGWLLEAAEPSLARCLRLLSGVKGVDFVEDTTLVRLALQAWIVWCLQRVFRRFLFGLDDSEDDMLRRIFERVQKRQPLPVAARWRALTRRYARTLATRPISSDGSSTGFPAALDHAVHLLEMDILVGAEALLRYAGAHTPPGALLGELSNSHGRRIARVVRHAARLAGDLAERAPAGCEVFIVAEGSEHGAGGEGSGLHLCGCMESVDQECRQWVGQLKTPAPSQRGGRTAGTRTRTHTRAGTARNKSKTRSHAMTATTRTYADTNIRQWDSDDSDEEIDDDDDDDDSDEEGREGEGLDEDVFVEEVHVDAPASGHAEVVCSLGFGLRRVFRRPKRLPQSNPADGAGRRSTRARPSEEDLQRERRRGMHPKVQTLHGSESDAKSTYTKLSATLSSSTTTSSAASSSRTERQRQSERPRARSGNGSRASAPERNAEREGGGAFEGQEVEVLVKTDVLMSSTIDLLQRRIAR